MCIRDSPYTYSLINTPAEIDEAFSSFFQVFPLMVKLAEAEKTIELLAVEIEKTRRRVNALEYVLIPNLQAVSYTHLDVYKRQGQKG